VGREVLHDRGELRVPAPDPPGRGQVGVDRGVGQLLLELGELLAQAVRGLEHGAS